MKKFILVLVIALFTLQINGQVYHYNKVGVAVINPDTGELGDIEWQNSSSTIILLANETRLIVEHENKDTFELNEFKDITTSYEDDVKMIYFFAVLNNTDLVMVTIFELGVIINNETVALYYSNKKI